MSEVTENKESRFGESLENLGLAKGLPITAKLLTELFPPAFYDKYIRDNTPLREVVLPALGVGITTIFNLSPKWNQAIIEGFEEIREHWKLKDSKTVIKKTEVNPDAQRDVERIMSLLTFNKDFKKVKKLFDDFNNFIEKMPENVDKVKVLEALSRMKPTQFFNFVSLDPSEREKYLSIFYKKEEPKEEPKVEEKIDYFKEAGEHIANGVEKVNNLFKDDRLFGHIINRICKKNKKEVK